MTSCTKEQCSVQESHRNSYCVENLSHFFIPSKSWLNHLSNHVNHIGEQSRWTESLVPASIDFLRKIFKHLVWYQHQRTFHLSKPFFHLHAWFRKVLSIMTSNKITWKHCIALHYRIVTIFRSISSCKRNAQQYRGERSRLLDLSKWSPKWSDVEGGELYWRLQVAWFNIWMKFERNLCGGCIYLFALLRISR